MPELSRWWVFPASSDPLGSFYPSRYRLPAEIGASENHQEATENPPGRVAMPVWSFLKLLLIAFSHTVNVLFKCGIFDLIFGWPVIKLTSDVQYNRGGG